MPINVIGANKHKDTIFGYKTESTDKMYVEDVTELYSIASKSRPTKKLIVFGGLHGYGPGTAPYSGEPVGQDNPEKTNWSIKNEEYAKKGVGTGINFTYKNVAIYTTDGSEVIEEKQNELIKLAKDYADSGDWIVLIAWCFSVKWLNRKGL